MPFFTGISRSIGGFGGVGEPLGSFANPALSADQLYAQGYSSGVYYINASNTTFQTYCLMNTNGGNWILAFSIHDPSNSSFGYNGSYWSSIGEQNVSESNLDPAGASAASLNVATFTTSKFVASNIMVSYRYRDGNYSNYLTGSSTDSVSRLTTARTATGQGFTMSQTGTDWNGMVWNTASSSTAFPGGPGRHNEWKWNASQSGYVQSGGVSYARLGQANVAELYLGNYYSNNARGIGLRSANNCSGNSIERGGGQTNARHSAGGCGDGPSTSGSGNKFEVWLR